MRPITNDQNVIQYPLNELFGTPANVRLIRVLAEEVIGPIGASEAAERTGLTLAGARRALARLVKTGFVRRVGGGRSHGYIFRDSDPVTDTVRELFRREGNRYRALKSRIRKTLESLPEIQAVWIDSSPTQAGQPLQLGLLSDTKSLRYLGEQVRKRLGDIEQDFDLTIEVRAFSRADVPDAIMEKAELIVGHLDTGVSTTGGTHAQRDERAVRFSAAIAKMLDNDSSLIKRATRHLEFLLDEDQGAAAHDLREWHDILSRYSAQRVQDFLVSETPRAQRLRQSSPFFAVLSPEQRENMLSRSKSVHDS